MSGNRDRYLSDCRELVLGEIQSLVTHEGPDAALYRAVLDYPLRDAKALRPALCIATARALGGMVEEALPTATALELFHNAFLIHDDVEDASEERRGSATLQRVVGEAQAINVGDAMLALALQPLLQNLEVLDLGRALNVLDEVAFMARTSAEGQALELAWIREGRWDVSEDDYVRMVRKKTAAYTFVAPLVTGGLVARAAPEGIEGLRQLGDALGVAFQIRDDLLNLAGDPRAVGKETCGDLWEAKRTLVVTHFARTAEPEAARAATALLDRPRPEREARPLEQLRRQLAARYAQGALDAAAWAEVEAAFEAVAGPAPKTTREVAALREELEAHGSLRAARDVADCWARRAEGAWNELEGRLAAGVHTDFLASLVSYVVERDR